MPKSILFVTGNDRKIWQAKHVLEPYGITIEQEEVEVDEIQHHEPEQIAIQKARDAFAIVQKPLVVCDHFWRFHALKGFPGGYMKDINQWFAAEDFLALMKNKKDRSVTLSELVVYIDREQIKSFGVEYKAKIIHEARGKGRVAGEQVTVFEGSDKTIAEHIDNGEHARPMDKSAWKLFGEWYK